MIHAALGSVRAIVLVAAMLWWAHPAAGGSDERASQKVARVPMRTGGPKSLDPVRGSTTYDNMACSQVYECLLQYKYLKRPLELEPLLLEEMPRISPDGKTWSFRLKPGVRFQDDPCFPGGVGRAVTTDDVFYSWKRLADKAYDLENWWLLRGLIVGFDEYKDAQNAARDAGGTFNYDAPVPGLRKINDREFQVLLNEPVQQFIWRLAMFQLSIVPREAVEHYGTRFSVHPVGTGPFIVREADWRPREIIIFNRNPAYREEFYPSEHMPEDEALGLHLAAGQRLPIVDRVEVPIYVPDPPMWLDFQSGALGYTQTPAEYFEQAFNRRTRRLRKEFADRGIVSHAVPLLDFIFRGFNMQDPVVGGYTPQKRALRQAISLAMDLEETNQSFYNGTVIVYDGPIPPGLDGYPPDGRGPVSFRGPDVDRAKALLAQAGYPGGAGLPEIEYWTDNSGNSAEQVQLVRRQLGQIGVKVNPRMVDFATLIETINNKRAQMFSFAWHSDYPDAENNLALFYGPNQAPGANHFNYENAEYDALYESIRAMPPGPERTAVYERMRDMIQADTPFVGSMARTRFYLVHPWLKNFKPSEDFHNWYKYIDVAEPTP